MESSTGPDQTAPEEQSDLGLHCLLRLICLNTEIFSLSYFNPFALRMAKTA